MLLDIIFCILFDISYHIGIKQKVFQYTFLDILSFLITGIY